jgi:hypothetical protein
MKEWEIPVVYNGKPFKIKAVVEYQSVQIMRIRVYGTKGTLLLQTNYPMLKIGNSRKGVDWKIKEGSMADGTMETTKLFMQILETLEYLMKRDFSELYPGYL